MIDSGDIVEYHGEKYCVACRHDDWLYPVGWPSDCIRVDLCTLIESATPEKRNQTLLALASSSAKTHRPSCARQRLASMGVLVGEADG